MADQSNRTTSWRERLVQTLDLPRELIFNLPRITVIGRLQFVVENHQGLVIYQPHRLVVAVKGGRVEVRGKDLSVAVIYAEELAINGRIDSIQFYSEDQQ